MPRPREHSSGCIPLPGQPMEEHHLEACLDFLAHLMGDDGEVYAPIYARLEMELEALRKRQGPIERARLRHEAQTLDGGLKAIGALDG